MPDNVCKDGLGNVRRVRLWTSSLQRTIRTVSAALTLTLILTLSPPLTLT